MYGLLATYWILLELKHWKDVIAIEELEAEKKKDSNSNNIILSPTNENDNNHHNDHNCLIIRLPLREQLQTSQFVLVAIFALILMLRCNYYIMTINNFLYYFVDDINGYYVDVFSYLLPSEIHFFLLIK